MGVTQKSHPHFFVLLYVDCLEVVNRVCFGTILGILWVEIAVCV